MTLLNIVNINDDRKERKALKADEKAFGKRDYGYSVYEAVEYGRNMKRQNDFGLHMEMIKNYVR